MTARYSQAQTTEVAAAVIDPRYDVLAARDIGAKFFYGVITTWVYCRVGCGARLPRPENVRFFETQAAARTAGYRACKRCRPETVPEDVVAAACRRIAGAETAPALAELAADAGLSPFHFHRLFKAATGITPKAYANAQRAARLRSFLQEAPSVTRAIYEAGYNTSSRFYETADAVIGMPAKTYQSGGVGADIRFATSICALGVILVAASPIGVCAISMGDGSDALITELKTRFPAAKLSEDPDFAAQLARIVAVIKTPWRQVNLPLDIRGTVFQQLVWKELQKIPAGSTVSYRDIAARIGAPQASRAVATACATNQLALAIPCHRVVRADGGISGYRWGKHRKRQLLDLEAGKSD